MSSDLVKDFSINSAGNEQDSLKSYFPAWIILQF